MRAVNNGGLEWARRSDIAHPGLENGRARMVQKRSSDGQGYWLEGGLAGGIGLGVLGGVMGHGLCADME